MNKRIFLTVLAFSMFASTSAYAQTYNEQIDITAPYQPSVNDANKINTEPENYKIKLDKTTPEYNYEPFKYSSFLKMPAKLELLQPVNYDETAKKNILSAIVGFGTNLEPLVDINVNSIQKKKIWGGFSLYHNSAWRQMKNVPNNTMSSTKVAGYGNFLIGKQLLAPSISYTREGFHYYGVDPSLASKYDFDALTDDSIHQTVDMIDAEIALFNAQRGQSNYNVSLQYSYLQDKYSDREHIISLPANFNRNMKWLDNDLLNINFLMQFVSTNALTSNNFLTSLSPVYMFSTGAFDFNIGGDFALYTQNGNNSKETKFKAHPIFQVKANIIPQTFNIHIGVNGSSNRNTFKNLFNANHYIATPHVISRQANSSINNDYLAKVTDTKFNIYAGFDSKICKFVNFSANAKYIIIENLPLYTSNIFKQYAGAGTTLSLNEFVIQYVNLNELVLSADVTVDTKKNLLFNLHGNYYSAKIKEGSSASQLYNLPLFEVFADARYKLLNDKLTLGLEAFCLGSRVDKDVYGVSGGLVTLKPLYNMNLSADYSINDVISVWLNINNMLHFNNKAQLWYCYPIYPINAMVGITLSM